MCDGECKCECALIILILSRTTSHTSLPSDHGTPFQIFAFDFPPGISVLDMTLKVALVAVDPKSKAISGYATAKATVPELFSDGAVLTLRKKKQDLGTIKLDLRTRSVGEVLKAFCEVCLTLTIVPAFLFASAQACRVKRRQCRWVAILLGSHP